MKKDISIGYKLSAIVLMPTLIALYFSYSFLAARAAEVQLLDELAATTQKIYAITQFNSALQDERSGLVSSFISPGETKDSASASPKTDIALDRLNGFTGMGEYSTKAAAALQSLRRPRPLE